MKINYQIEEQDALAFQLFNASQSKSINKKKTKGRWLLTFIPLVVAVYFYLIDNFGLSIYFVLVGLACAFFYPTYFIWRYKKHYKNFIKENYANRLGRKEHLELNENYLYTKDYVGESKINLSEIEKIDETNQHFFIRLSSSHAVIIPKRDLLDISSLKERFNELGLKVYTHLNGNWK